MPWRHLIGSISPVPHMPNTSVIMPCFNHGRFVADSARAILDQTAGDLELIVVDDWSQDNSWEAIQGIAKTDSRVRAIRHECNQGASSSRNDGLRAASAMFIAFCDADDIWEPGKLEFQTALLRNNPEFDVTYSDSVIIGESGVPTGRRFSDLFPLPKHPSGWLFQKLATRNFINMQTVLMRRECIQHAGYFDLGIKWVEDWWFWLCLSADHRFLYSPEPLARYRVHSASTNLVQQRSYAINRFRVFRRMLQRYAQMSASLKADVFRNMGGELLDIGKRRAGRRLLWQGIRWSWADPLGFPIGLRAFLRLLWSGLPSMRARELRAGMGKRQLPG
jgi:glycosyltransferase involved in cell wall biosynthesis